MILFQTRKSMSPCYWKDSVVNLFPGRHFRIPLQCFLNVNGQGLLFPKTSARYSNFMFIVFVLKTILFASLDETATNCPFVHLTTIFCCCCFFLACFRCLLATQTRILPFITNSMNRLQHATHVFNQQLGITTYQ